MAQKTTAELISQLDANIAANGTNAITGDIMNSMLRNIIDSLVNKSSDALSIVGNVYRSDSVAISTSETQVTFNTPLAFDTYKVIIEDTDGIGFENINDLQTTGFKITGLTNGTIIYFVIKIN